MPFEISVVRTFSAAHQLVLYDGSLEPLHGHNWRVEVTVAADELDAIGVVMDFHQLEEELDHVVASLHNSHLNATEMFKALNPTAEHVALSVGLLLELPKGVALSQVCVWETPENKAVYRPSPADVSSPSRVDAAEMG